MIAHQTTATDSHSLDLSLSPTHNDIHRETAKSERIFFGVSMSSAIQLASIQIRRPTWQ